MAKTKQVALPRVIRVDEEVHEKLAQMAEDQHRSIANLIGVLLLEAIEKHVGGGGE